MPLNSANRLVDEESIITPRGIVAGDTVKPSPVNRPGRRLAAWLALAICMLLPLLLVCSVVAEAQETFDAGRRA